MWRRLKLLECLLRWRLLCVSDSWFSNFLSQHHPFWLSSRWWWTGDPKTFRPIGRFSATSSIVCFCWKLSCCKWIGSCTCGHYCWTSHTSPCYEYCFCCITPWRYFCCCCGSYIICITSKHWMLYRHFGYLRCIRDPYLGLPIPTSRTHFKSKSKIIMHNS